MSAESIRARGILRTWVNQSLSRAERAALNGSMEVGIRTGLLDRFADHVTQRFPRLVQLQGLTPEFTARYLDLTSEDMVPLGVVGHFSHLDHVLVSHLCHELRRLAEQAGLGSNMRGFVETLASSVPKGQQSTFIKGVYAKMEAYARNRGLEFIPITREVDEKRYNMTKKPLNEIRPLIAKLRQKGIGALIPAGGSVQPGRHLKGASGDEIFGLQEIIDTNILDLYGSMGRSGKHVGQEPYFLPIAIYNTHRVCSADSLLPTPEGLISLYDMLSRALSLIGFRRIVVTITPGMPITAEDMVNSLGVDWRNHPKEAIDFLMTEVARKLPPNARGYYGKFVAPIEL